MDIRDKWLGIKQLKKHDSPNPYSRREGGSHIGPLNVAESAARYLATVQCAPSHIFPLLQIPPPTPLRPLDI
eukprot:12885287-Prorocentrum_lima.AAC.1